MVKLIREENEALVKEIDCEIKNKFRWSWLQRTVSITVKIGKHTEEVTEKLSDYIAKCDVPGKAQCLYCNDVINYGSRGCVALIEHATKSKKHAEKIATRRSNYSLGAASQVPSKSSQTAAVGQHITKPQSTDSKPLTALADRKAHSEALVLGVVAEHSLPLTLAPVILDTARELAKDPKALNHMNLERTTASYKMRFGLAKTFSEETIEELKSTPFSLNIDKSTSNNDKRVLAILVSYYSSRKSGVIVEHLASLEVIRVNSQSLFNELDDFFKTHDIPWGNVVSILMDSCSVMRGSKNGLETKIRNTRAPQLLDIDGDSCHHLHNACKKFAKPFDNWVEHLQSDLHNDVKWSPDLRQYLQEVCDIMGIKFTMPERFITHRWLSCYDACNTNIHMVSALKVFYFPFLSEKDQLLYRAPTLKELHLHHATDEGVKRVKEIWNTIGKKSLTDDGKRSKGRIADKLIVYYTKTITIMHFYLSVLPLLKEYVSLFQSNEPLIHVLHDKQEQVFTDFLSCFIKSEVLIGKSAKQLKNLNLEK